MGRRPSDPRFAPADVRLGYVSGVHGLRGEVKVFLYNEGTDLFDAPRTATLVGPDGERRPMRLSLRQGAGRRILGRLDGVSDREAARALMKWEIVLDESQLPALDGDSWYHRDLLGLPVRTEGGRDLGRVAEIHDAGEVDVWLLRGAGGQRVLPVLPETVLEVTVARGDDPGGIVVAEDAVDEGPPV